jgi:hypothetical protein
MGLLKPTNQPALAPAQLVAQDFQIIEHATVGVAKSK